MDFAAEGLLDGLEGPERQARLELLERLAADGVSLNELKDAVGDDRLVLLPVERALGGQLTGEQVAQRAGIPIEQLVRLWRALGFPTVEPDEPLWDEEEVAAAEAIKRFLDAGVPEDAVIEITRVLGEGMSRLAPAITDAFADAYLEPGDNERDVALRYAAMFMSPEASALVAAALSLIEAAESGDLPALRAGMASGPVIRRAGDLYGNAVNLASRVTGVARPGSVLCTEDVRDAARDGFAWSSAGRFRLKGVEGRQPLYRARRLEKESDEPNADSERHDAKASARPSRSTTKPTGDRPRRRGSN